MTDMPSLNILPQDMKRSDSNLSNFSDEVNAMFEMNPSGLMDFAKLENHVGALARSKTLENEMEAEFLKSPPGPVDPNEVATKKTPPNGRTGPPPISMLGDENERSSRVVGRKLANGSPVSTILHTLSGVPRASTPPFNGHRNLGVVPDMLLEATKNNLPPVLRAPPLTSRPSRPLSMLDARPLSPPVKTTSPPIGRPTQPALSTSSKPSGDDIPREFIPARFGTEKRPSRRRLPQKAKDGPSGPKTPTKEAAEFLKIVPDKLRDSTTGPNLRPVFSTVRPIVCHYTNTPFYAQCSTAKMGWCTWCQSLRPGNQKQGSICLSCGERLTAKYHRWYPALVRLEPLERDRHPETYRKYRPLFEHYSIGWNDEKQFQYVIQNYMLMKIYLSTTDFEVDALHLERAYMIGVFAGREFQTGAMARKLLREGCGLAMFRADFPEFFEVYLLREERAAVAEHMNQALFLGHQRAYFHAHHTNIEGWYDQNIVGRDQIVQLFKDLCNNVLQKNATAALKFNPGGPMINRSGTPGGEGFSRGIPSEPNKEEVQTALAFLSSVPNGMPMDHALFGVGPMGSPPMMMGPPPAHLMNPPHGMIPPGPPHGPHIFSPVGFAPSSPMNPTIRHSIMTPYGAMPAPMPGMAPPTPNQAPYGALPGFGSVSMTPPTPPPPMLGASPFDRQFSGGSSVSGATFVPHNMMMRKSR